MLLVSPKVRVAYSLVRTMERLIHLDWDLPHLATVGAAGWIPQNSLCCFKGCVTEFIVIFGKK